MPQMTFANDDEFAPTFRIDGVITIRPYRVAQPILDGEVGITGRLDARVPRPQLMRPLAGQMRILGVITGSINKPSGAFKDFAHYPYSGTDPAMAMLGVTSGALLSGASGSYSRQYAAFTAPTDYPVSGGNYAWKRAAYASVGFKFANMSANKHQILDAVQLESMPIGATGPTPYQTARSLSVVVRPTRLNYATNPNFESGITGAVALNSATLASDTFCWKGTAALKVTVPATGTGDGGYNFQVTGLVPGRRYTLSARVAVAQSCGDVYAWNSLSDATLTARTTYAKAVKDPAQPRWRTVSVTFNASKSTAWLGLSVSRPTMTPGQPSIFWADAILVEEGASARPYFDGSMGADYLWETGGTANLTRSYYYENRAERGYLLRTLLDENVPLGITAGTPRYAVLTT